MSSLHCPVRCLFVYYVKAATKVNKSNCDGNSNSLQTCLSSVETCEALCRSLEAGCDLPDHCSPSPCQHGGSCLQTWQRPSCDCSAAGGHSGPVCSTSPHWESCWRAGPGPTTLAQLTDIHTGHTASLIE